MTGMKNRTLSMRVRAIPEKVRASRKRCFESKKSLFIYCHMNSAAKRNNRLFSRPDVVYDMKALDREKAKNPDSICSLVRQILYENIQ
jgi:hypothetical protein